MRESESEYLLRGGWVGEEVERGGVESAVALDEEVEGAGGGGEERDEVVLGRKSLAADGVDDTVRQAAAFYYRNVLVGDAIFPLNSPHLNTLKERADTVETAQLAHMIEFDAMPRPVPVAYKRAVAVPS